VSSTVMLSRTDVARSVRIARHDVDGLVESWKI